MSAELRTFLPLLMLGLAARFHLGGVSLNQHLVWIASTPSLVALGCATAAELAADKIPLVDHALHLAGTVTRPAAATLAAAAAFQHADPPTMAILGLILGAPTALAVHTAQSGARLASTATTAGLANPLLSGLEDIVAFGIAGAALMIPVVVPAILLIVLWIVWRVRFRKRPRIH